MAPRKGYKPDLYAEETKHSIPAFSMEIATSFINVEGSSRIHCSLIRDDNASITPTEVIVIYKSNRFVFDSNYNTFHKTSENIHDYILYGTFTVPMDFIRSNTVQNAEVDEPEVVKLEVKVANVWSKKLEYTARICALP